MAAIVVCVGGLDQLLELANLTAGRELRRDEPGVFQQPVSNPQVLRHERVVIQGKRSAASREVFKLAAFLGFPNAALNDGIQAVHGMSGHATRFRTAHVSTLY